MRDSLSQRLPPAAVARWFVSGVAGAGRRATFFAGQGGGCFGCLLAAIVAVGCSSGSRTGGAGPEATNDALPSPGERRYVTPLSEPGGSSNEVVFTPPPAPELPIMATVANQSPSPAPAEPVRGEGPAPAEAEPAPASARPDAVVDASELNVRMAPGTDATRLTTLTRGAGVEVIEEEVLSSGRRWSRIRFVTAGGAEVGWVASEFLRPGTSGARGAGEATGRPDFGDFADLHYDPVPKPAYQDNPRVDAKGIYLTLLTLRSTRLDTLLKLAEDTHVNAFVIDFKDDIGALLTRSGTAARLNPEANGKTMFSDPGPLIKRLKDRGLYLIARIVTFKDPVFAAAHPGKAILDRRNGRAYQSRDGLTWASPHDADFRAYNVGLAKEAARLGFNEVQFDYVRFPDVPKTADLDYRNPRGESKARAIQSFLLEARRGLAPLGVYVAADVFGLVCTTVDDMRIGQYWEAVSNAADYVCPMMYPSHYANETYGLDIPDRHPYALIQRSIRDALERNGNLATPARLRPWIQGFTATWVKGHLTYDAAQVKAQIRALADNGVHSWLVWHPGNRYNAAALR
ncbi:MAG: SH3 domain-containing protein [Verrucomicrobiales bacterium]|nr:SH3 domain-containing protein [Verrucomicrobiales bacterium]